MKTKFQLQRVYSLYQKVSNIYHQKVGCLQYTVYGVYANISEDIPIDIDLIQ